MPRKVAVVATDMEFFEDLYRRDRQKLINYATAILWKYGAGNMSVADRAEEVVQDAFCLAWKKRDDPTFREFPSQWMCKTVVYKVREALREDRKWVKCLTLLPEKMVVDEPWEMYGDNVIEKCGKGRDDTGDIGKRRNFNGKSEHFRRERPAFHK